VVKAVFFKVRQEQTQPAQVRARQVV
jgi:hypothetical protein